MASRVRAAPESRLAEPAASPRPHWTPRSVWRRAREVVREEGWKSLWFKVLGETVYRRAWVRERPFRRMDLSRPLPPELVVVELSGVELEPYLELHPGAEADAVRSRLAAGERCFVGSWRGRPVHSCWVGRGRVHIPYLDRTVELAPDEAYRGELHTAPHMRGRGVARAVTEEVVRRLSVEGCNRAVAVVMPENRLGELFTARLGRGRLLRTFWVGPWKLHFGEFPPPRWPERQGLSWDRALRRVEERGHYLDPFLGEMKRSAHLRLLREWGELQPGGRLLKTDLFEEAIGPDAFLAEAAAAVRETVGIDVSPAVVQRARRRFAATPIRWVVADVRELPLREGSFSSVVSTSTLDHFSRPADLGRSLRELRRLLEPGGRLVVTLDNRSNFFDPLLRLARRLRLIPYFVGRSYTVGELRSELAEAGLEVLETTAILHNPRLVAVGAMRLARLVRVRLVATGLRRLLVAAQRLEESRLRYLTGSFVAACARRPASAGGPAAGLLEFAPDDDDATHSGLHSRARPPRR